MDISVPEANYPSLTTLNVSGNAITELDVSGLTKLEDLAVANNQLTEINVAANRELTSLSIANNKYKQTESLKQHKL